ncbi:hypothetical protein DL96DRAFT_1606798 [Flagelloscypha sp. PMI_526]|nr:hypothetical protein DL96DRAFT_1606798 [Flagelloscypha sp. PMI_526]
MKLHFSALTLLASSILVSAQFPDCSLGCIDRGITDSGCSRVDWACICSVQVFWDDTLPCLPAVCSAADTIAVLELLQGICGF